MRRRVNSMSVQSIQSVDRANAPCCRLRRQVGRPIDRILVSADVKISAAAAAADGDAAAAGNPCMHYVSGFCCRFKCRQTVSLGNLRRSVSGRVGTRDRRRPMYSSFRQRQALARGRARAVPPAMPARIDRPQGTIHFRLRLN